MRAPKQPIALTALALLCLSANACGTSGHPEALPTRASSTASGRDSGAAASVAQSGHYLKKDGDIDSDDRGDERHGDAWITFAPFPHRASTANKLAVTALVRRYYIAATAENGAQACSLLSPGLVRAMADTETYAGESVNARCAKPMSQMLVHLHSQLVADEAASMVVTSVHVKGNLGVAMLGFWREPEREILVERERAIWKIDALFDGAIS